MAHGIVLLRQFEAPLFCCVVWWPGRSFKAARKMDAKVQAHKR
jgi:hypothetical protein